MSRTARELASHLGAQLEGDPAALVTGVASPEVAGSDDLIYVDSPKHLRRAAESAARCVLLGSEMRVEGKTQLRVARPKLAFAQAAAWLLAVPPLVRGVHATAVIAPSARLAADAAVGPFAVIEDAAEVGDGAQVGAFCYVGRGARIGARSILHPHVILYAGAVLGREVVVHAGCVIGGDGFGYVFDGKRQWKFPQVGSVDIGDHAEIGCNTCVDRGALEATHVGAGTKIDNLVQVAHNVHIGEHSVIAAQTGISGSCRIGNQAVIGGQVGLGDHCRMEDGAILSSGAGVPSGKTIRRGEVYWGTPARPLSKFKEQYAWLSRLPALGPQLRKLRGKGGAGNESSESEE